MEGVSLPKMLQRAEEEGYININCVDPLGRSALLMAIDNENLEMVELLIEHKVETKDALLHAISEEFVEAVEVLLDHEETIHKPGEPHNEEWEKFQNDLLTSVRVANDFKTEAQQDLQKMIMENKAHRERVRQLENQINQLKGHPSGSLERNDIQRRSPPVAESNTKNFTERFLKKSSSKSSDSSGKTKMNPEAKIKQSTVRQKNILVLNAVKKREKVPPMRKEKSLSKEEKQLLNDLHLLYINIDPDAPPEKLSKEQKVVKELKKIYEDSSLKQKPVAPTSKDKLAISKPLMKSVYNDPKLQNIATNPNFIEVEAVEIVDDADDLESALTFRETHLREGFEIYEGGEELHKVKSEYFGNRNSDDYMEKQLTKSFSCGCICDTTKGDEGNTGLLRLSSTDNLTRNSDRITSSMRISTQPFSAKQYFSESSLNVLLRNDDGSSSEGSIFDDFEIVKWGSNGSKGLPVDEKQNKERKSYERKEESCSNDVVFESNSKPSHGGKEKLLLDSAAAANNEKIRHKDSILLIRNLNLSYKDPEITIDTDGTSKGTEEMLNRSENNGKLKPPSITDGETDQGKIKFASVPRMIPDIKEEEHVSNIPIDHSVSVRRSKSKNVKQYPNIKVSFINKVKQDKKSGRRRTISINLQTLEEICNDIDPNTPDEELTKEQQYARKLLASLNQFGRKATLKRFAKVRTQKVTISVPTRDSVEKNPKLRAVMQDENVKAVGDLDKNQIDTEVFTNRCSKAEAMKKILNSTRYSMNEDTLRKKESIGDVAVKKHISYDDITFEFYGNTPHFMKSPVIECSVSSESKNTLKSSSQSSSCQTSSTTSCESSTSGEFFVPNKKSSLDRTQSEIIHSNSSIHIPDHTEKPTKILGQYEDVDGRSDTESQIVSITLPPEDIFFDDTLASNIDGSENHETQYDNPDTFLGEHNSTEDLGNGSVEESKFSGDKCEEQEGECLPKPLILDDRFQFLHNKSDTESTPGDDLPDTCLPIVSEARIVNTEGLKNDKPEADIYFPNVTEENFPPQGENDHGTDFSQTDSALHFSCEGSEHTGPNEPRIDDAILEYYGAKILYDDEDSERPLALNEIYKNVVREIKKKYQSEDQEVKDTISDNEKSQTEDLDPSLDMNDHNSDHNILDVLMNIEKKRFSVALSDVSDSDREVVKKYQTLLDENKGNNSSTKHVIDSEEMNLSQEDSGSEDLPDSSENLGDRSLNLPSENCPSRISVTFDDPNDIQNVDETQQGTIRLSRLLSHSEEELVKSINQRYSQALSEFNESDIELVERLKAKYLGQSDGEVSSADSCEDTEDELTVNEFGENTSSEHASSGTMVVGESSRITESVEATFIDRVDNDIKSAIIEKTYEEIDSSIEGEHILELDDTDPCAECKGDTITGVEDIDSNLRCEDHSENLIIDARNKFLIEDKFGETILDRNSKHSTNHDDMPLEDMRKDTKDVVIHAGKSQAMDIQINTAPCGKLTEETIDSGTKTRLNDDDFGNNKGKVQSCKISEEKEGNNNVEKRSAMKNIPDEIETDNLNKYGTDSSLPEQLTESATGAPKTTQESQIFENPPPIPTSSKPTIFEAKSSDHWKSFPAKNLLTERTTETQLNPKADEETPKTENPPILGPRIFQPATSSHWGEIKKYEPVYANASIFKKWTPGQYFRPFDKKPVALPRKSKSYLNTDRSSDVSCKNEATNDMKPSRSVVDDKYSANTESVVDIRIKQAITEIINEKNEVLLVKSRVNDPARRSIEVCVRKSIEEHNKDEGTEDLNCSKTNTCVGGGRRGLSDHAKIEVSRLSKASTIIPDELIDVTVKRSSLNERNQREALNEVHESRGPKIEATFKLDKDAVKKASKDEDRSQEQSPGKTSNIGHMKDLSTDDGACTTTENQKVEFDMGVDDMTSKMNFKENIGATFPNIRKEDGHNRGATVPNICKEDGHNQVIPEKDVKNSVAGEGGASCDLSPFKGQANQTSSIAFEICGSSDSSKAPKFEMFVPHIGAGENEVSIEHELVMREKNVCSIKPVVNKEDSIIMKHIVDGKSTISIPKETGNKDNAICNTVEEFDTVTDDSDTKSPKNDTQNLNVRNITFSQDKTTIKMEPGSSDQIENIENILQPTSSSNVKVIISEKTLETGDPKVFGGVERYYEHRDDPSCPQRTSNPSPQLLVQDGKEEFGDQPKIMETNVGTAPIKKVQKFSGLVAPAVLISPSGSAARTLGEACGYSNNVPEVQSDSSQLSGPVRKSHSRGSSEQNLSASDKNDSQLNLFHFDSPMYSRSYVDMFKSKEQKIYEDISGNKQSKVPGVLTVFALDESSSDCGESSQSCDQKRKPSSVTKLKSMFENKQAICEDVNPPKVPLRQASKDSLTAPKVAGVQMKKDSFILKETSDVIKCIPSNEGARKSDEHLPAYDSLERIAAFHILNNTPSSGRKKSDTNQRNSFTDAKKMFENLAKSNSSLNTEGNLKVNPSEKSKQNSTKNEPLNTKNTKINKEMEEEKVINVFKDPTDTRTEDSRDNLNFLGAVDSVEFHEYKMREKGNNSDHAQSSDVTLGKNSNLETDPGTSAIKNPEKCESKEQEMLRPIQEDHNFHCELKTYKRKIILKDEDKVFTVDESESAPVNTGLTACEQFDRILERLRKENKFPKEASKPSLDSKSQLHEVGSQKTEIQESSKNDEKTLAASRKDEDEIKIKSEITKSGEIIGKDKVLSDVASAEKNADEAFISVENSEESNSQSVGQNSSADSASLEIEQKNYNYNVNEEI